MADIFISYAAEDKERIAPLAGALEEHGFTVWWDADLRAGDTYDEVIEEEIEKAKCVIVAWSDHSLGSRWVRTEANEAMERDILVPITLDSVRPPLAFRLVQAEKFTDWTGLKSDECWQRLIVQVDALIAKARGVEPDPAPDVEEIPDTMLTEVTTDFLAKPRLRLSIGATIGFALSGFLAASAAFAIAIGLGAIGANPFIIVLGGGAVVVTILFYHLFAIAEAEVSPQSKALAVRWLMPVENGLRVSSGEAFNNLFEAAFGRRHFSFKCIWRSTITSFFFQVVFALCIYNLLSFLPSKADDIGELLIGLFLIGAVVNVVADYISLFQTRIFLRIIKAHRFFSVPLVVADFFLTGVIYGLILVVMVPTLDYIFITYSILDVENTSDRAAYSVFLSLILTTYITSAWLWLVLFLGPIAKFILWSKKSGPKFFGKVFSVQLHPFKALASVIGIIIIILGFGLGALF